MTHFGHCLAPPNARPQHERCPGEFVHNGVRHVCGCPCGHPRLARSGSGATEGVDPGVNATDVIYGPQNGAQRIKEAQ